ncbi:oxidoreductase [Paenibacillus amylolyticus]|uniref:Gfo/Idh/MocA family oxidoreductase n=1 Tax=Paenibacillus TaxID=44249 RepID=UPI0003E23635|nr:MULTISPECIES: Gfo/Idh/MocA family oxidoreductase [Paenibacillus]ETT38809.1 oxidoreductase [Paenibacillus sp. FSL R5-192]ETT50322.1 oxidoreductase [Paenibacillus sp. FSL H7-689]OME97582.1 oxidoreductase [Paenibacillus amylolyticus]
MLMNVAIIGFGNAVVNYHFPYLDKKENIRVKMIYRREEDRVGDTERESLYPEITFSTNIEDILQDDEIELIVIATHVDSHVEYAKLALERGKHVLVEKPFASTSAAAKDIFELANRKNLIAMANQNRRFDGDFLTLKKVIESGKLGNIVEIQSHYDYFHPQYARSGFGLLHGLAVHTIDQLISIYGVADRIEYDVRSLIAPGESDDYIDIDFRYGRMKATIKCSLLVKIEHPKFIVHGDRGSFVKYSSGHQTKNGDGRTRVSIEAEPENNWGTISYVDDEGTSHTEKVPSEATDYGVLYDQLFQAIRHNGDKPVKDEEVLYVLDILHDGIEAAKRAN